MRSKKIGDFGRAERFGSRESLLHAHPQIGDKSCPRDQCLYFIINFIILSLIAQVIFMCVFRF